MLSTFPVDDDLNLNAFHSIFFFFFKLAIRVMDHYRMDSVLMDFLP